MKQIFKPNVGYDTFLVWHCKIRHTDVCKLNHRCLGTNCKMYELTDGSSVAIDPEYKKPNKKDA